MAFAALRAVTERSWELFLVVGFALVVVGFFGGQLRAFKLGPTGVDVSVAEVVEQVVANDQPPDLKLAISTGLPMGLAETLMGSDHVVQLTAVNTGGRPLGINSLGIDLSDGRWVPFLHSSPTDGNVKLPAVLQPQQSATVYQDYEGLVASLREGGLEIKGMRANLADGSTRRWPVPDDWRRPGR